LCSVLDSALFAQRIFPVNIMKINPASNFLLSAIAFAFKKQDSSSRSNQLFRRQLILDNGFDL